MKHPFLSRHRHRRGRHSQRGVAHGVNLVLQFGMFAKVGFHLGNLLLVEFAVGIAHQVSFVVFVVYHFFKF